MPADKDKERILAVGRKTTILVWVLTVVVFSAGAIMVAVIWLSLVDIQKKRSQHHTINDHFTVAEALLNQELSQLRVFIDRVLNEKTPPPTELYVDKVFMLVKEYRNIVNDPELAEKFKAVIRTLNDLTRISDKALLWKRRFYKTEAELPAARQNVLSIIGEMKEKIDIAEGKLRINQAMKFKTFNKSLDVDEGKMAQSIIENFSQSKDLSTLRRNIVELMLLCEQLRREDQVNGLESLKNERFQNVLDRLHYILDYHESETIPEVITQVIPQLKAFENALFGTGFSAGPGRQKIFAGQSGEYTLLEKRLRLLNEQASLHNELEDIFSAVYMHLQAVKDEKTRYLNENIRTAEKGFKNAWLAVLLIWIFTATAFSVASYHIIRAIKQQILEVEATNIELDTRTRALQQSEESLQRLSSDLFNAQDAERRRISIELHDELGQSLAALKIHVSALGRNLDRMPLENLHGKCDELREKINEIIENVRRLSRDLNPVVLDELGLQAAIENLINTFSKAHNLKIRHEISEIDHLFDADTQRVIYRIMQEIFTNISKHAGADLISVDVSERKNEVRISISDNGKGFDYLHHNLRKKDSKRGMGLDAMKERVRIVGGTMKIKTRPGVGTTIDFSIPT